MTGDSDIIKASLPAKAKKAPVHHSPVSEHFRGSFPLFVNRFNEGFELREHDHEYLELVYVMSGEGYHYVGSSIERTTKGCLYILPVGTSHILRPGDTSGKNSLIVYNLCILPEFIGMLKSWLSSYSSSGGLWTIFNGEPGSHIALLDKAMRFREPFEQLHREFAEQREGYETSMFSILLQLTVQISRQMGAETGNGREANINGLHREMSGLLDYVNQHIAEPLTLGQLSMEAGLSRRHFIRRFRQLTGMGFSDYLQHKRIELACRLLLETGDKIETIANSTGYRDLTHFRQVFRKIMGTSPKDYRKGGANF
ncbi:AraC family transcriptional regulator ['Paenibacillus yunnanensis' Narsing Rao et al. 2020]|uniref:AraC family transcriptional regulator n=1 Tax=Paenibacillus tengchongensis TaxID=2608684 RepID=UPI00124DB54B|nr:AraC family transcriptional regulator [Paenibacillus tengchongensis]